MQKKEIPLLNPRYAFSPLFWNLGSYLREPGRILHEAAVTRDLWATARKLAWTSSANWPEVAAGREVLIVSMTGLPFLAKFHGLLALLFRVHGWKPVILLNSHSPQPRRYLRLFGAPEILVWKDWVKDHPVAQSERVKLRDEVKGLWTDRLTLTDLKRFEFHEVYVGKHALSTVIRKRLRGQFDLQEAELKAEIQEALVSAMENVLVAGRLFEARNFAKVIVRDAGYLPNAEIYEVGLVKGADCIRCENGQERGHWLFKRYTLPSRGRALFSLSPETWSRLRQMPLTPAQQARFEQNWRERYDPKAEKDLYKYQVGKVQKSPNEVRKLLDLDPKKKTAVVFSHISWDASFFDGEDLYDDYEQWLVETVRCAIQNPRLNWVIKLHPANQYKLKRERQVVVRETELDALAALGELPPHIKILSASTDINTQSLFPIMDYGITVRGTIGMELPCLGIPALTAGTGRFDGYGFTVDSKSRAEYECRLATLHEVPRLSAEIQERARRHGYWALVARQASFNDVALASAMPHGQHQHPLHYNLDFQISDLQSFRQSTSLNRLTAWLLDSKDEDLLAVE